MAYNHSTKATKIILNSRPDNLNSEVPPLLLFHFYIVLDTELDVLLIYDHDSQCMHYVISPIYIIHMPKLLIFRGN